MPISVQWDSNLEIVQVIEGVRMVVMPTILARSCSCAWDHYHVERTTYLDPNCNFVWWTTKRKHVPIHPTFNFVPCSRLKSCHASPNHHWPPPCFTVWWTCWGPTRSPSPIQHHDLPYELNLFIFVSSLKTPCFQSSMVQFSNLWANLRRVNMFTTHKWFHLLHLCT